MSRRDGRMWEGGRKGDTQKFIYSDCVIDSIGNLQRMEDQRNRG